MHQSSWDKMRDFRIRYLGGRENEKLRIYDLGSQDVNGSYRSIFGESAWIYKGIDMEAGKNVDIVLENPYSWKEIPSDHADIIISGQVFEHVRFFWITMLEIARILKPGGICCIIAPSGGFEHRYPVDCWRFYPDGFQALADYAGLDIKEVYTQWNPDPRYNDDSNAWKDSVLVCEKPVQALSVRIIKKIEHFLLRKLMLSRLENIQKIS